ncbi:MAG: SDR family oxidoreductase [Balneolaceae bacterium]
MISKQILITGASRGIGYETALSLANEGHRVIATARSEKELSDLKMIGKGQIYTVAADLTTTQGIQLILTAVNDQGGSIDGLINNAGLLINKPFPDLTDRDWQDLFEVNLLGPARLTRELVNTFNKNSHILNISSMGGYQQSRKFSGLSGYSSLKGGLVILSECLAEELKPLKISSNCLCLGAVQTEMFSTAFPGMTAPVQPEEMGRYIAHFLLEGHRYFNGKSLPVALADPD